MTNLTERNQETKIRQIIALIKKAHGTTEMSEHPAGCFNYNSDIIGNDLNNGLADKVDSATECVNLCLSKYPSALYFTWSDDTIADPNYRLMEIKATLEKFN